MDIDSIYNILSMQPHKSLCVNNISKATNRMSADILKKRLSKLFLDGDYYDSFHAVNMFMDDESTREKFFESCTKEELIRCLLSISYKYQDDNEIVESIEESIDDVKVWKSTMKKLDKKEVCKILSRTGQM